MKILVPILIVIALSFMILLSYYYFRAPESERREGVVIESKVAPAYTKTGSKFSLTGLLTLQSGPTKTETFVPEGVAYLIQMDNGEKETVIADRVIGYKAEPTAVVGNRVAITTKSKWIPLYGTWILSKKLERLEP